MNDSPNFFGTQLGGDAQEELEKGTSVRLLKRGEILYRVNDAPQGIYSIQSGLIGLVATGPTGNEYLLRLAKAGQYIGHRSLFAKEPHHATATALENSRILFVSKSSVFRTIETCPKIALVILEELAKELKNAELGRLSIADKNVTARIAESLIYLKERFPNHQWTRREIAEFCGSTTPTVIRKLAKLETDGIIRQSGRKIEILKRSELIDLSS